jgi:hypothetical protein
VIRPFLWGFISTAVLLALSGLSTAALFSRIESRPHHQPPIERGPYEVQLVYAIPAGGPDRMLDRDGSILASVDSAQRWLRGQTGGRAFVFAGTADRPSIIRVRLSRDAEELYDFGSHILEQIDLELRAQGIGREGMLYAVYYEGDSEFCGLAERPPALPGHVMALFLGTPQCAGPSFARKGEPADYWEFSLLHELFHLIGAVPDCAPNEATGTTEYGDNHVLEPSDLMYQGNAEWAPSMLDVDRDDYFGHGRDDCFDAERSPYLQPVSSDVEPPVAGFAEWRLAGSCDDIPAVSDARYPKLSIYVSNLSTNPVELHWLENNGESRFYRELYPWESILINSPVGTTWEVRDGEGGCLSRFTTPDYAVRASFHGQRDTLIDHSTSTETASQGFQPAESAFTAKVLELMQRVTEFFAGRGSRISIRGARA